MISINYLFDILKYLIAGAGVVGIAFYLIKPYLERGERIQMLEIKKAITSQTLPLRLQAYERVVLFIDRINPANLLVRINAPAYTAQEAHSIIITEIRNEYQHNITQQIYMTNESWAVIKKIKDDTVNMVNNVMKNLPPDASGLDVSRIILSHMSQIEENPYDAAADLIKADLEKLF